AGDRDRRPAAARRAPAGPVGVVVLAVRARTHGRAARRSRAPRNPRRAPELRAEQDARGEGARHQPQDAPQQAETVRTPGSVVKFPISLRVSLSASMVGLALLVAGVALLVHVALTVSATVDLAASRASAVAQQASL